MTGSFAFELLKAFFSGAAQELVISVIFIFIKIFFALLFKKKEK